MFDFSTAFRGLFTRLAKRRLSTRTRRARTLGAAGFAGVSVGLLATELPSAAPPQDPVQRPRPSLKLLADGLLAMPVRFADAGSAEFLRPGDRIDVLAAADTGGPPGAVPDDLLARPSEGPAVPVAAASGVTVLAVPEDAAGSGGVGRLDTGASHGSHDDGGLVLLAVDNATAARLARAAVRERLTFALHPT